MSTSAAPSSRSKRAPPASGRSTTRLQRGANREARFASVIAALDPQSIIIGKSLFVGLRYPFGKRRERVAGFNRLVERYAFVGQPKAQGIAGLELQLFAHLARNHGPAIDRDLRESGEPTGSGFHHASLPSVSPFSSLK